MILSGRFGGTPWEWRRHGDLRDWGSAVAMLMDETRELEEAADGRA